MVDEKIILKLKFMIVVIFEIKLSFRIGSDFQILKAKLGEDIKEIQIFYKIVSSKILIK